jgi:hypothetical protein
MFMETIESIVDTDEGFDIITDRQTIRLHMEMRQYCCESPGYFLSEDNRWDFIGAHVLSVSVVDEALSTVDVPDVYSGGVMFVNIETDKGLLQFVAYNAHNGYYGHTASVTCIQVTESVGL